MESPNIRSVIPTVLENQAASSGKVVELPNTRLVLYTQKHGNMTVMVVCDSGTPALVPYEWMNRLVETLEKVLGAPIVPMKIQAHLSTAAMIVNEMVDNDGFPLATEPDVVRGLVPHGGLLTKLLQSATPGSNSTSNGSPMGGISSASLAVNDLPWRRPNVRHTNNELYIDLVETIYAVITPRRPYTRAGHKSGGGAAFGAAANSAFLSSGTGHVPMKPLLCRLEGAIFVTSHLSGVPTIDLSLSVPPKLREQFANASLHQCIDLARFENSTESLGFTPPDGKSLLASYTTDLPSTYTNDFVVHAELKTRVGMNRDEFEVRVWTAVSRSVKHIESLSINVVSSPHVKSVKSLRLTAGDFHIVSEGGVGEWRFPGKTALGWSASLHGVLVGHEGSEEEQDQASSSGNGASAASSQPCFPTHLTLSYQLTGQVPSGIKVNNLRISAKNIGDGVKPYKGVRYTTQVGEYIVRAT
ncbi:hypothetical protein TRVA0_083S00188 [Trichomonascus vanleenenianus]|uniref:Apm3p n=1 Tax=Trichomonascus vanleenenianus TaxID=2268995 RepID=UPI003ECA238B